MGENTTGTSLLLTDDERRAKLDTLLAHRFTERGQLQLPNTQNYNSLSTDKGLQAVGVEMCRWLGLKPNGLKIQFTNDRAAPSYTYNVKDKTISIRNQYVHHPYTVGGLLALATISYFIERYDHQTPDRPLIEFATIETGLSLWILNALRPKLNFRQKMYHLLDSAWFHADGLQLSHYSPSQYAERTALYARDNRISEETYIPHVLKRCQYLLPNFTVKKVMRHLQESNASIRNKKAANMLWAKIVLTASIIAAGVTLGIYAHTIRPTIDSTAQVAARDNIFSLKSAYNTCITEAFRQQNTHDPNDLFMTRQVDAKKAECESRRNEYNYAVDQYESIYSRN